MEKQIWFIKVTTDHWMAKNKLQQLIKDQTREYDQGLVGSYPEAKKLIADAVDQAHRECPTKCKPHKLWEEDYYDGRKELICSGVSHITIYQCKNLTNNN